MQGKGRINIFEDFCGIYNDHVWGAGNWVANPFPGIGITSVNEGTIASTVDESGGVLAVTTDTADNDNFAFISGKFAPRDGRMRAICRVKLANVTTTTSLYFGFAETMALDTPVMPAEHATATMTYNPGGQVGFQFDIDSTTKLLRACMGDGGGAISDSGNGIAGPALTADSWIEMEVILNEDGSAELWAGTAASLLSDGSIKLKLVKRFYQGTLLTPADLFFATLVVENRTAAAVVMEVDYFGVEAGRDWRP